MQDSSQIAIIITCFNYEAYVDKAIKSVLNQTCRNFELVVIDDGSTDNSWKIINQSGVAAFRTKNGGQREACLLGLSKTSAPFILFLDADDELGNTAIETIQRHLDDRVSKVQFSLKCVDATGKVIAERYPVLKSFRDRNALAREVLRSGVYQTPPTSGNVFRRDVCEILHETGYERAVDGVILFAAPFLGDVVSLSEPLGIYRIHGQNDSGLGKNPTSFIFERDLRRFESRIIHLNTILARMRPNLSPISVTKTYYYNLMRAYASICRSERLKPRDYITILVAAPQGTSAAHKKIAELMFLAILFVLPPRRARALLTVRLSVEHRSLKNLILAAILGL